MPKPSKKSGRGAATLDDSVAELGTIADQDRGNVRERAQPTTNEDAEEAALEGQRTVYERVMGKKTKPRPRRDLRQRDERAGDDEEEEDEPEETEEDDNDLEADDEETDLDERDQDGEEGDDAEAEPSRRSTKKSLEKALNALRRINAPAWVFREKEGRILQLAESMAGYQANADQAIRSRDETIKALSTAVGKGTRAQADDETPEDEATPSADDLEDAASGLARAMGVEGDPSAKKAIVDFARKTRGKPQSAAEMQKLRSAVQDLMIDKARNALRRNYPERASDPDALKTLVTRMGLESSTGRYEGDYTGLVRRSLQIEFGDPAKRRNGNGREPARKAGRPVMHERRERTVRTPSEGTEEHDRAVFNDVTRRSRGRFAVRR